LIPLRQKKCAAISAGTNEEPASTHVLIHFASKEQASICALLTNDFCAFDELGELMQSAALAADIILVS
jgi:hypothetical protein